jgi:hypothetical protein
MPLDTSKLSEHLKKLERHELFELYKIYTLKMNNSDEITWKSASIFVPLSLTGIVLALKDPQNIIYV